MPWRRLLPWLLATLLLHAWWLAPEPPPPLRPPSPALQWRLAPPLAASQVMAAAGARDAPLPLGHRPRDARPASPRSEAAAETTPALLWPKSGSWHYRLRWQGEEGVAQLEWRLEGEHYVLSLHRQLGSRSLPSWQSEGRVDSLGLRPLRFIVQRASGRRQRVETEIEPGAQDRLSWILQVAAIARAQAAQAGQSLALPVSGWRGGVQTWTLLAEHDPEAPDLLRLRRLPPSGGAALEQLLWLDPARAFLPVRLRQRYDAAERWELQLESPPVGASTPPAP